METAGNVTYVDTHSHLAMLDHAPLQEILMRASAAGVHRMISVSTDEGSWESNRNIALAHTNIYYTVGLHPHDAIRWTECAAQMDALFPAGGAIPEKCVGIGELGLDFHYNLSPPEVQLDVLESQFTIARRAGLPVIIHCRDAFDQLYDAIRRVGLSARTGVMHCFTGGPDEAKAALDLGLKISFSGILTFKNAGKIREAAKMIPDDCLLVETDCPFLAPIPFRGKPNEPSYLPMTAQTLAVTRGVRPEVIAELTTRNAISFFGLG